MIIRKNNQSSFPKSSLRRFKGLLLCLCFFLFASGKLFSQDYLSQYEELYPGCVDNEESIIFGGIYPNPWPKNLTPPEFPGGGDVQLSRYVHSNVEMDYPNVLDYRTRERIKGTVLVEVVIDRCGRPTRQRIVNSVDEEYDMVALNIIQNLPVFKPGSLNGERVKVALTIPVYFMRNTLPPKKKSQQEYDYYDINYDDIDW